tara:strand:- start:687 stop:896 length:210 start_codon:yes stop_codon:yes gene_type:complete
MYVERSVERDVKTMSLGLDAINFQISALEGRVKLRKAERKRLDRLQAVKVQMVENPKDCEKLVKRYKEM